MHTSTVLVERLSTTYTGYTNQRGETVGHFLTERVCRYVTWDVVKSWLGVLLILRVAEQRDNYSLLAIRLHL